jgi:tetratricopeptide (TPR) repeat protein
MAYSKLRGARKKKNKEDETSKFAEHDAVQEQGMKVIDQLLAHPYFIFGTVAAIIVVVIVGLAISSTVSGNTNKLSYAFAQAVDKYDDRDDSADKYKESIKLFEDITKTQSGAHAQISYIYMGKAHYHLKEFGKAVEAFKKAREEKALDNDLLFTSYEGEALCYLDRKEFDKAIELWKEWLNKPVSIYKDHALYYIGYSLEKSGKEKEALVYFKRLKDEFPKSMLVGKIIDKLPTEKIELPKKTEKES